MESLSVHIVPLISILGLMFAFLIGSLIYIFKGLVRQIDELIAKIDKYQEAQKQCQIMLPITYLSKMDFVDFKREMFGKWDSLMVERKKDWEEMWRAFNNHRHAQTGEVIRGAER